MPIREGLSKVIASVAMTSLLLGASLPAVADNGASQPSGPWAIPAPSGPVYLLGQTADLRQSNILLAQASPPPSKPAATTPTKKEREATAAEPVDAPWYGRNNMHKYLGLASLGSALIAAVSPKEKGGPHEFFADASLALGVAAVGTGAYAHWGDLDFAWSDPDTKHALFGTLGVLGFAIAVAQGGEGGHAGAGAAGAVAMFAAIKYEW